MTKQQIVVHLAAAKLTINGNLPSRYDLESYGKLADKIIEMFPEPDYTLTTEGTVYSLNEEAFDQYAAWDEQSARERRELANATVAGDPLVVSVEGMKQTFSTSVSEEHNA